MQTQQTYISEKVRNSSNVVINPATEEKQDAIVSAIEANTPITWYATEAKQDIGNTTLTQISQKKIWDSFWLKNVLSAITRLTVDASWQLRAVVSGTVGVSTITTLTTLTTWNIGIWDSGKVATMISQSNANFQWGWRRLIRKV